MRQDSLFRMSLTISKKKGKYETNSNYVILVKFYNQMHIYGFGKSKRLVFKFKQCTKQLNNKRINMYINFILFKVYIEKYTNWSNLKVSKDKYETIIDFGKYRLYLS